MKSFSEKDWKLKTVSTRTSTADSLVNRTVITGGPYLKAWLAILYKEYLIGSWNGRIPNPEEIEDQELLSSDGEEYCIFHQNHPKFGRHIIEAVNPYLLHSFVFFDYSCLKEAFEIFDKEKGGLYIPTYYAKPEDRHDYDHFES